MVLLGLFSLIYPLILTVHSLWDDLIGIYNPSFSGWIKKKKETFSCLQVDHQKLYPFAPKISLLMLYQIIFPIMNLLIFCIILKWFHSSI